jgi:myo-inositol-1(or 4)-monophosphatase
MNRRAPAMQPIEPPKSANASGTPQPPLDQECAVARAAATEAGAILLAGWGTRPTAKSKSSAFDLVTEFDGRSEAAIVARLAEAFPDDGLIGEEGTGRVGSSGRAWHVDPLDGTTNFTHGLPLFAVSIGLCQGDDPILGVVSAPALGWTFVGGRGIPPTFNDRRIAPSDVDRLERALLVTGFPYVPGAPNENMTEFAAFMHSSQGVRRLGSAALDLCFVACGWLDGYWERNIKSWDLVAGAAIVLAAGGSVCDPGGGPFAPATGCVVASNGRIQASLLATLAGLRPAVR